MAMMSNALQTPLSVPPGLKMLNDHRCVINKSRIPYLKRLLAEYIGIPLQRLVVSQLRCSHIAGLHPPCA